MLVNELKPGDVFYGINVSDPGSIEVNKVKNIHYRGSYVKLEVETIIGMDGGEYTFPIDYDLNKPIITQYSFETIWIYSTDIEAIVELNENLLKDQEGFVKSKYGHPRWSIWTHCWI